MQSKKFPMSAFFSDENDVFLASHSTGLSVYEEGDTVVIEAALPGLNKEGIEISHAHGYILIEGEKKEEKKKRKYYRKAISSFTYRVPVPPGVDIEGDPDSNYSEGVMKVTLRKKEK